MTYEEQLEALMKGAHPDPDTFDRAALDEAERRWRQRRYLRDRVAETANEVTFATNSLRNATRERDLWAVRAAAPKLVPIRVQAWDSGKGWVECRLPREGVEPNATIVLGEDGRVESFTTDSGWVAHPENVGLYP